MKKSIAVLLLVLSAIAVANAQVYQPGFVLGGTLSSGESGVRLACVANTTKNSDGARVFVYDYTVEALGKNRALFQAGIIDRVLSGRFNFPTLLELKKGKIYKFSLTSNESPVLMSAPVRLFRKFKPSKADMDDITVRGTLLSGNGFWGISPGSEFTCPIPPSLLKPLGEK